MALATFTGNLGFHEVKRLSLLCFLLCSGLIYSQPDTTFMDQLRSGLVNLPVDSQITELIHYSRNFRSTDSSKSLWVARYAVQLGVSAKPEKLSNALLSLGHAHKTISHYDSAIYYYRQVLDLEKEGAPNKNRGNALMGLGSAYAWSGYYEKGITYYQHAADHYKKEGDNISVGKVYTNIGNIYNDSFLHQHSKALDYYQHSLSLFRKEGFPAGNVLLNMAYALKSLHMPDSALMCLREIDSGSVRPYDYVPIKTYAFIIEGDIYADKKEYARSLQLYDKADSMMLGRSMVDQKLLNGKSRAWAYYYSGAYEQAVKTGEEMLSLMDETGNTGEKAAVLQVVGKAYESLGKPMQALSYMNRYIELYGELSKSEALKQVRDLEAQYRMREKDAEIELLHLNNRLAAQQLATRQANQNTLLALIGFLLLGAGTGFYYYRRHIRLKQALLNSEISSLKSRIKALVTQNPEHLDLNLDDINAKLQTPLTPREFEVLQAALSDRNNREIAEQIHVSVNTVKFHLKNIYEKLGVSNRREVVSFVMDK